MRTLYTLALSPFVEKARWALDLMAAEFPSHRYREVRLLVGPHRLTVRRLTGRRRPTHLPVLVEAGGVFQGSGAILDRLSELGWDHPFARPAKEAEAQYDRAFGEGLRTVMYGRCLEQRDFITRLWCQGAPRWAPLLYAVAWPTVARAVRQAFCPTEASVRQAEDAVERSLDDCDKVLLRQPFLGGESPSRADLAAAALLAPIRRPATHPFRWPAPPVPMAEWLAQLGERPTLKLVDKLYAEQRWAPQGQLLSTRPIDATRPR